MRLGIDPSIIASRKRYCARSVATKPLTLVVEEKGVQRFVHVQAAVVIDESHLPEAIHEVAHPGARGTHHFRKRFLVYFGKRQLRLLLPTQNRIAEAESGARRFSLELQT